MPAVDSIAKVVGGDPRLAGMVATIEPEHANVHKGYAFHWFDVSTGQAANSTAYFSLKLPFPENRRNGLGNVATSASTVYGRIAKVPISTGETVAANAYAGDIWHAWASTGGQYNKVTATITGNKASTGGATLDVYLSTLYSTGYTLDRWAICDANAKKKLMHLHYYGADANANARFRLIENPTITGGMSTGTGTVTGIAMRRDGKNLAPATLISKPTAVSGGSTLDTFVITSGGTSAASRSGVNAATGFEQLLDPDKRYAITFRVHDAARRAVEMVWYEVPTE